jgi:hypothetical protein
MGGSILAESAPWCGSTFYFVARFGVQANPQPTVEESFASVDLRDKQILLVEDGGSSQFKDREALTGWGGAVVESKRRAL